MGNDNNSYKYVMQDNTKLYLGAKYTYEEVLEEENVPFKLKAILQRYILTDLDVQTSLESHFYYMNEKNFDFKTFQQLKTKIKVSRLVRKNTLLGKESTKFQEEVFSLEKFVEMSAQEKEANGIFIQEISFSKLALMSFSA